MIWDFLQHVSPFAGFSALLGLLITAWLLWDIIQTKRRQVRIDHEWRLEQEAHDRLAAAATPHLYRGKKGFKKAQQKVIP